MLTTLSKRTPFFGIGFDTDLEKEFEKFFGKDFGLKTISTNTPRVNFKESDEEYVAELEVPGISKDELKVSLDENLLTVSYEHNNKKSEENENYKRMEFSKKSFERTFSLPKDADLDSITSKCENGILYIDVPKISSDKKAKRVIDIS
jgi:HSP20 family protein